MLCRLLFLVCSVALCSGNDVSNSTFHYRAMLGEPLEVGKTLILRGKATDGFSISLHNSSLPILGNAQFSKDTVAPLHISVRFDEEAIVFNFWNDSNWGAEDRKPNPWKKGDDVDIKVTVGDNYFIIYVDNKCITWFHHRFPFSYSSHLNVDGGIILNQVRWGQKLVHYSSMLDEPFEIGKTLILKGRSYAHSYRFAIALHNEKDEGNDEFSRNTSVPLYISVRYDYSWFVFNSWNDKGWAQEDVRPISMKGGDDFDIRILAVDSKFLIFAGKRKIEEFVYRLPLTDISKLRIYGGVSLTQVRWGEKCELPFRSNIGRLAVGSQLVLIGEPSFENEFQFELGTADGGVALRLIFDYASSQLHVETGTSKNITNATTTSLDRAPILFLNIRLQTDHLEVTIENNVFNVSLQSSVINYVQLTGDLNIRILDVDGKALCPHECVDTKNTFELPDLSTKTCQVPLVQPISLREDKKNNISIAGTIENNERNINVILGTVKNHTESLHLEINIADATLSIFSQNYGITSSKKIEKEVQSKTIDLGIIVVTDGYKVSLDGKDIVTYKSIVKVTNVDRILVNGGVRLTHILIDGMNACSPNEEKDIEFHIENEKS